MAWYNVNGNSLNTSYDVNGSLLNNIYDINGTSLLDSNGYITGTSYSFSDMTMTDTSSVTTTSNITKNSDTSISYNPTVEGNSVTSVDNYEKVVFDCNIDVTGQNFGIWIHISPEDAICYGGRSLYANGIAMIRFAINDTWYANQDIKVGWSYLFVKNTSFTTISSITFGAINNNSCDRLSSVILDSLEVGFSLNKGHVMFNLDCVPSNFYDVGYPLFEQYGLKCTLNYHISSTDATAGADSDYYNSSMHTELVNAGYDFGVYSGWQSVENYGEVTPNYDDDTIETLFEDHAERMWYVNADSGVDAPTCVHGTGFWWGCVYNNACTDYNFLMIRQGCTTSSAGNGAVFTYFDPDTRTMIPHFIQGGYTADNYLVTRTKARIDYIVETKQALQIGFHKIIDSSGEYTDGDMYMGSDAVGAILAYVKEYVDAGQLVCCTTSEFVQEVAPDLYNAWNTSKGRT